jgi:hypothetical protein
LITTIVASACVLLFPLQPQTHLSYPSPICLLLYKGKLSHHHNYSSKVFTLAAPIPTATLTPNSTHEKLNTTGSPLFKFLTLQVISKDFYIVLLTYDILLALLNIFFEVEAT